MDVYTRTEIERLRAALLEIFLTADAPGDDIRATIQSVWDGTYKPEDSMPISDGPWHASVPHMGGSVITNPHGRIIAAGVPNPDDAAFICEARAAYRAPVNVQIDWKAFGRAVATARKAARYSQNVAAELCGISRNYMSMIERGVASDPGYTIVFTLCQWLDLEMPSYERKKKAGELVHFD